MRRSPLFVLGLLLAGCSGPEGEAPAPLPASAVPAAPAAPTGPARPATIAALQGTGARSAYVGEYAVVEGVVTGPFLGGLGGVFIQSLQDDGNPATSEGLWLPRPENAEPRLRAGDHVRATGTVAEIGEGDATLTALADAQVEVLAQGVAFQPLKLEAPPADWEALEGMRVRIEIGLDVVGLESLGRFGELAVAFDGPVYVPTELSAPAGAGAIAAQNAARTIRLDDGSSRRDPDALWYLPAKPGDVAPLRAGSRITGIEGVVDQRFGGWRIQLTDKLGAVSQADRPAPPQVPGDLRIASLNVLNLFNGDGRGGAFEEGRGARNAGEYQRQQKKLVALAQGLDADIIGLMEIENDGFGPESAIAQFVAALNAAGPHSDWRFVDAGAGPGEDMIRVALVYRGERVAPVGDPQTLLTGPFAGRSRAPLLQAFRAGSGPVFAVAVNHFKSKGGCDEARGDDVDRNDGQGCWNDTRQASARALHMWLEENPTGASPVGTVVIGDLNAYSEEDPVRLLRNFGWRDAFALVPPTGGERPYSFIYGGQRGRLDHALLRGVLSERLRGVAYWNVNAAEADLFDYRTERPGTPGPWRASDHDPVLLGFDLRDEG
ncbi:ExeM/NucH family extracellular endonuclease [Arenimonas composti]|uniref:Endonuclease/exonuclease/phosphatase domain-containing protein n=1 Tax=Arenimonas composti TR7-09 = DSM 18010 TaxID=1121013 RepID=A0A091B7V1_9GAMM|nr:ExeM/NucH family extracellular endonuclease [Arenimonas composti]KFN48743.1 hypothetical protein P873_13885 [Arenimonas composti TR7-09 = DSM 18010]